MVISMTKPKQVDTQVWTKKVMVSKHIRGCQKRQDLSSKAEEEKEYRQMEKKIKGQYKANEVQN